MTATDELRRLLDELTVRGFEDDELHALADRLRAIGGGE